MSVTDRIKGWNTKLKPGQSRPGSKQGSSAGGGNSNANLNRSRDSANLNLNSRMQSNNSHNSNQPQSGLDERLNTPQVKSAVEAMGDQAFGGSFGVGVNGNASNLSLGEISGDGNVPQMGGNGSVRSFNTPGENDVKSLRSLSGDAAEGGAEGAELGALAEEQAPEHEQAGFNGVQLL